MTAQELAAEFRALRQEEAQILSSSESLRDERERLGKEFYALGRQRKELTAQINALHGSRLREVKARLAVLARAMMALKEAERGQ